MRFLPRCFVGKQWNLFMSLWVHFYFNLNRWWPGLNCYCFSFIAPFAIIVINFTWEESLGPHIFHHISAHENISSCKNILLIINWCGGLVLYNWPVWWRLAGRMLAVVVAASPEDWPRPHWDCWGRRASPSSDYTGELQWSSLLWQTSPTCNIIKLNSLQK